MQSIMQKMGFDHTTLLSVSLEFNDLMSTNFLSRLNGFEYEMRETIKQIEYHAELADVTEQVGRNRLMLNY